LANGIKTYKLPRRKNPTTYALWSEGSLRRQIKGIGRIIRNKSVSMFGIETPKKNACSLTHLAPGRKLASKIAATGTH
jgi:hypothetical protein